MLRQLRKRAIIGSARACALQIKLSSGILHAPSSDGQRCFKNFPKERRPIINRN
jgi:hypothetical protein